MKLPEQLKLIEDYLKEKKRGKNSPKDCEEKLPELEKNRHFVQMAVSVHGGRLTPYYYQPKFAIVTEILNNRRDIVCLNDLAASINNGIEIRQYVDQGTPYLRVSDMKADGIDLSDVRRVVKEANEIPHRIRLREGDLLISRSGTFRKPSQEEDQ